MADDVATVPDGHRLHLHQLVGVPGVARTPAGAIIASLGTAGDDPDRELDEVLAGVERELATARDVEIVVPSHELSPAELFAPAQPPTRAARSPITWCFHAGAVASVMASPRRRDALLARMHRGAASAMLQTASIVGVTPAVVAFAQVLRGLAIDVRAPDPSQGAGLAILVEVERSDGRTLCAIAGTTPEGIPPRFAPGELVGMPDRLVAIGAALDGSEPVMTYRSPRLRRIFVDAEASGDATTPVVRELLVRGLPAFVLADPARAGLPTRTFGDVRAVAVYTDVTAAQWAAADMQLAGASPAPVDITRILARLASGKLGLAIGLYKDRQTPMYVIAPPATVEQLASHTG